MPDAPIQEGIPDPAGLDLEPAVDEIGDGFVPVVTFFPTTQSDPDGYGYWGFGLSVSYSWDSGLRYAPLATTARNKVAIWRAHSEVTLKVVSCVVARVQALPLLPHIDTGCNNDVLVYRNVSLPSRELFVTGEEMIVVMVQYIYIMQMAQKLEDPIVFPNSVLRVNAPLQLNPASFSKLLQGIVTPPGDFGGGSKPSF